MEDLLPILIVIAISLVGAARKKKRKERPFENLKREESSSDRGNSAIFDWLEKLNIDDDDPYRNIEQEEPEPVIADPVAEEPKADKKHQNEYAHYTGFITPDEKEELVKKEGNSIIHQAESDIKNEIGKEEIVKVKKKKRFDLRQAVVHSVVLNRKY